jgi:hypothetical protein
MSIASRMISKAELADLGVERLAYVKRVNFADRDVYAVHGADGTHLCVFEDRDTAESAIRRHELEPASIH